MNDCVLRTAAPVEATAAVPSNRFPSKKRTIPDDAACLFTETDALSWMTLPMAAVAGWIESAVVLGHGTETVTLALLARSAAVPL